MNLKQLETVLSQESNAQAGGVISLVIGTFAVMFIAAVLIAPLATTILNAKNGGALSASENQTIDILKTVFIVLGAMVGVSALVALFQ